jgi:4-hydroxy 2-oxovalerate aldolase
MKIKMIDCTMRDGGYYNRWDFSSDLINEYLIAMDAAKID